MMMTMMMMMMIGPMRPEKKTNDDDFNDDDGNLLSRIYDCYSCGLPTRGKQLPVNKYNVKKCFCCCGLIDTFIISDETFIENKYHVKVKKNLFKFMNRDEKANLIDACSPV